jgi:hypothetical protein
MSEAAVHPISANQTETKMQKCVTAWQSSEQYAQKRISQMPKCAEAANPTLLVLNLTKVPVANVSAVLQNGGAEEAKTNKGARVTFMVLKVLSPGWTWVGGAEKEPAGKKGGGRNTTGGRAGGGKADTNNNSVNKDKLNQMLREHVLMHSYDLVNVKGEMCKSDRSPECLCISPGMVLSMIVWGKGFLHVFKEQKGEDLLPFDLAMVQVSVKSTISKSMDKGTMLDVKSYMRCQQVGMRLGAPNLFHMLGNSLQECAVMRSRFVDGTHVSSIIGEELQLQQAWLSGNVSTTVNVVKVKVDKGTFAIGPDDVLRFHTGQMPLTDLPCVQMSIVYDALAYGKDRDWVCKLFNVLTLCGAMELVVIMDSYKSSKAAVEEEEEMVLEAFARPNISMLFEAILTNMPKVKMGAEVAYVKEVFGEAAKQVAVVELAGTEMALAMDTRQMTKKRTESTPLSLKATLLQPAADWERGNALHFFMEVDASFLFFLFVKCPFSLLCACAPFQCPFSPLRAFAPFRRSVHLPFCSALCICPFSLLCAFAPLQCSVHLPFFAALCPFSLLCAFAPFLMFSLSNGLRYVHTGTGTSCALCNCAAGAGRWL